MKTFSVFKVGRRQNANDHLLLAGIGIAALAQSLALFFTKVDLASVIPLLPAGEHHQPLRAMRTWT